jgi:hypothetical protein
VFAMMKWLFVALLVVQAHFAASYLVPLDEQAQRTFGGLLRWAWPWAIGDGGPLGRMTSTGFPIQGFFLAVTAAGVLILAVLAVLGIWVPFHWWRVLAITGASPVGPGPLSARHEAESLRCVFRRIIEDGRPAMTEEPLSVQGNACQDPAKAAGQDADAGPRAKGQSLDSRESKRVRGEPEEVPGPPGL